MTASGPSETSLVTVSVIRDEADVAEAWARRHLPMVARMIVTLHRCGDATGRILRKLAEEGHPVDIRACDAPHYPQSELTESMLREAAATPGVAWILPLDADEFLAAPPDGALPTDRPVFLPWRTYVPTPDDEAAEAHVLRRVTHRRAREEPRFGKVMVPRALAADPDCFLPLGNHALRRRSTGEDIAASEREGLHLIHVPVRSETQLRRKIIGGWDAHRRSPDRRPGQIFQWEGLYDRCKDPRPIDDEELARIARTYAGSPDEPPMRDPVPGPHPPLPITRTPRRISFARLLRRRERVVVAVTANEAYARGAAVTVRSLLEHLDPLCDAEIWVLGDALSADTKDRLARSWDDGRTRARFVAPDRSRVAHLKLTQGMQPEAYFRLLAGELIPRRRALYLDSDMLVAADVLPLWRVPLGGFPVAAVPDVLLSMSLRCVPGWEKLGLDPDAPYFSSALLLMDLDAWRRDRVGDRVIETVERHPDSIRWWDQDGLNIALAGGWKPLDARWNVYVEAAALLGWKPSEDERRAGERLVAEQRIIHFATRYKPWCAACPHPKTAAFFGVLDRTAWAGWRPAAETALPWPP
jgi:lipopolysaccharide biosynthesis glycosyltransferase